MWKYILDNLITSNIIQTKVLKINSNFLKGGNILKLNVYILEEGINLELSSYLKVRFNVVNNVDKADVILVNRVINIQKGLQIVDYSLMKGKEIVCIKNKFGRE